MVFTRFFWTHRLALSNLNCAQFARHSLLVVDKWLLFGCDR